MTAVENISWSELLNNTNHTAQHGNDDSRIATATETLRQAAYQFANVLNERAKLLANSAQFDTALRDAAAIRALLPGSGLGYLCMGDVHCQQGRYAAAISIYDQGLEAVPESDQYYQQLQQHRMTAIANNDKRVDFISRLPLDIVITNIIPRLERRCYSDLPPEHLYVSHAWQERFLQQPHGLYFNFGEETETFKTGHDQLIRFAPYVQTLKGEMFDDAQLDDLFSRAQFSNLKELGIFCEYTSPCARLLNGLQLISDSLTRLSIDGYNSLQLHDILEACPNLVSLAIEDAYIDTLSLSSSHHPKITHLALHDVPGTDLDSDEMGDLLSRFPSLLSFEITPMPESRALTILHKHCPYLQVLYFGERGHRLDNVDVHPHQKGIKSAHLGGYGEDIYMQDDLIQFLYLHRDSLEEIVFNGDIDVGNDASWRIENGKVILQRNHGVRLSPESDPTQSAASFVRLASINFAGSEPSLSLGVFTWLISNSPNLKAITINESYLQPDVANAMIKLRQLSNLEIAQPWKSDDHQGIIRFLEHHIGIGKESTLKEITIRTRRMTPEATWIPLISKLQCLKNLKLHANFIPTDCLRAMDEIRRGCPALEELTLGVRGCDIGDGIINCVCQHSNLKHLRIGSDSLPTLSLILIALYSRLDSLYLQCDVPERIMKILRNNVSKIVINKA
ncbi:hypothetical protein O0I10_011640 [Lichtheimia ornata]|uniref:Uncharacterized protein n=1 Tax=Lichtheimia ornata TaxID=688661 RepID=A0AAD7UUG8_9FUNG|nr:uncharacterized protein O0I10_011640 [Lichtheimia ornata]KAJ8652695.1 hypothetical protein O0I10_011640 [Lichtheimia ornata]